VANPIRQKNCPILVSFFCVIGAVELSVWGYRHCRVFVDLADDVHAGVMEW
jgi:hypothetical protein